MRYLLDSHTLLWYLDGSNQLSQTARSLIDADRTQCAVSVVTFYEISIKAALGKLNIDGGFRNLYEKTIANGFTEIPLSLSFMERMMTLPFIHKDPFDRLIIATALEKNLLLVSVYSDILKYDISVIW